MCGHLLAVVVLIVLIVVIIVVLIVLIGIAASVVLADIITIRCIRDRLGI